jgi:hypothetical protein
MQIALFERPYSNKRFVYQILSSATARCCAIHGSKVSGGAHWGARGGGLPIRVHYSVRLELWKQG